MNKNFLLKILAYATLGGLLSAGGLHASDSVWLFLGILVTVSSIEYLGYRQGRTGKGFLE